VVDELAGELVAFAPEELSELAALVLFGLPPVAGRDAQVDGRPLLLCPARAGGLAVGLAVEFGKSGSSMEVGSGIGSRSEWQTWGRGRGRRWRQLPYYNVME